ncbi:MAG: DUF1385 domain-containing protein [Anaerolineales bacterium]|jgi:uncharacterized protein YqhQ
MTVKESRLPTYGGQALIEGVMMRGSSSVSMAMRAPDQQIVVHTEPLGGIYKSRITRIPFLRGLVALWDALGLGMRALTLSANIQTGEEEKLDGASLTIALIVSLTFGIGLFFLLPAGAGYVAREYLHLSHTWSSVIEGVIRLALLVGYIWAIGRMPEIRRVFMYHGAEHKTINAFEDGATLTPEIVERYPLEHPRCGTAFLLTLVLISIFLFTIIGPLPIGLHLLSRVLLIPVLAGIAYEYIRWTANHLDSPFVRLLIKPNLALQGLTTREPTLDILEVSIAAFNSMRSAENQQTVV